MSDYLTALRLFIRVAQKGNFSAAGREANMPQSTVSRLISGLEKHVGAVLFIRTTRAATLTEAGAEFRTRIEPILAALTEAEHAVRGTGELRGVLRVGLSSSFAIREMAPRLPRFMDPHPLLRLEMVMSDDRQDLVTEGVDLVIRFGQLPDSTAVARRIGTWRRVLVASPDYLKRAGVPLVPADLSSHSIILGPSRPGHVWDFRKDARTVSVKLEGRLTATVNEVCTVAAVAGLGIASMTYGAVRRELEAGTLAKVLDDWDMGAIDMHAVFPPGGTAKPAAQAFVRFLLEDFAAEIPDYRTSTAAAAVALSAKNTLFFT